MKWPVAAVLGLLGLCGAASADDDVKTLNDRAVAAYQAKDYAAFLKHSRALHDAVPWSTRGQYNLACALALTGDSAGALAALDRLAAQEVRFDLGADADLASLRALPGFAAVERRMDALKTPLGEASPAATVAQKDVIPEGVAYDAKTGSFFVSSVHHRKIVRVARDGAASDFVKDGQDGLFAVMALGVDELRRALWASSQAVPQMVGYRQGQARDSFLAEFDLDSGRLRRTVPAPAGGMVIDFAVRDDGTVFAADPEAGALYVLDRGAASLRTLVPPGGLRSAQGIAPAPDGRSVYVADYGRGIARVDTATGAVSWVAVPADTAITGVDGIALASGWLLGIQNGIEPHRVIALKLDAKGETATLARTLVRGHAAFDEPTLGVVVGDGFCFVANSQYGHFRKDGSLDENGLVGPVILKTPLPR